MSSRDDAYALYTTPYDPIMGLSIPQWSLLWSAVLVVILVATLFKRNRGDLASKGTI
ncbi:hypothetical protein [Collimonas sp. OK607]|uniref:hypothetical protein n=1 Tax=Collimonas sp. OK607 TaxID=1798194 RepID=UPI000A572948|nr:hypothetical protein [Collimonas sp. OK607]